jgi:hypothetical protein
MTSETIISIISAVTGTGVISYMLGYKKSKAETKVVEADAIAGMQKAYHQLVEDYNKRFEEMEKTIKQLQVELDNCKKLHR